MGHRKGQRSYVSVKWFHTLHDEPKLILSELDAGRVECRKIEYFLSGKVGVASRKLSRNGTMLSAEPIPTLDHINADPQFQAEEIDAAEFEAQWNVHV